MRIILRPVVHTRSAISQGRHLGGGGICPPDFENSDFLVFLPTEFGIFHILPPLGVGQNFAPLEKTEMTSLQSVHGLRCYHQI